MDSNEQRARLISHLWDLCLKACDGDVDRAKQFLAAAIEIAYKGKESNTHATV